MTENITLQIWTPERTAFNQKVYRVVLPTGKTTLTVIEDRAPTSMMIYAGVMQILNPDDSIKDWYFIDKGVADIAQNVCRISTAHLLHHSQITIDKALELKEKEPENAVFYNMIALHLQAFAG